MYTQTYKFYLTLYWQTQLIQNKVVHFHAKNRIICAVPACMQLEPHLNCKAAGLTSDLSILQRVTTSQYKLCFCSLSQLSKHLSTLRKSLLGIPPRRTSIPCQVLSVELDDKLARLSFTSQILKPASLHAIQGLEKRALLFLLIFFGLCFV